MSWQPRNLFQFTEISPDLFVYHGAVNTGILRQGPRAILIDCDDTLTPARLAELGITHVERIYCTQHRRPNTAGIPAFGAAVFAPRGERRQFEQAGAYWADWHNRWHLYHYRPGPLAPLQDIVLSGTVEEGDHLAWGGFKVSVLATPGMTDGAVSYAVQPGPGSPMPGNIIFSGDVLYGPGQVWDVHSLQKTLGTASDYHGFLGATGALCASLNKLAAAGAAWLVPSHGDIITQPAAAAHLSAQRLEQLLRNYAAISAMNFYFPQLFAERRADPMRMAPAATFDFPDFIHPVAATSFAIRSETGALFLVDCGNDAVLDKLEALKQQDAAAQVEGCWVTHYHDDHVDALHHLAAWTHAPIYAEEHVAAVITRPARYWLPCISPAVAPVACITRHGETWRWHEFELTSLHLPGQSFYHGGLLLRGHGLSVLFCGDSFAPTGLDDYTAGNRNFLGAGRGYRRCIDLLRQYRPDLILNQHQQKAFHFTDEQLSYMEELLAAREALLAELLPWEDANYGTDAGWLRADPYQVEAQPGATCIIAVQASRHGTSPAALAVEAVLPPGWSHGGQALPAPGAESLAGDEMTCLRISIVVPPDADAGIYPIPLRVTWNGRYLGQVCHALVVV